MVVAALVAASLPSMPAPAAAQQHEPTEREYRVTEGSREAGDVSAAQQTGISPVPRDASGALQLAQAIVRDPASLVDAGFAAVPPSGTPHGLSQG